MAEFIRGEVTGDSEVITHLKGVPPRVRGELELTVRRLAITLQQYVKQDKLSGQVLRNRTGTLRRSITHKIFSALDGVRGIVGTNVSYARPHEFGFKGQVNVKQHLRNVKMAFGRQIEPVQAVVGAHTRNVNLPERSFLRSSLKDKSDDIKKALREAVLRGTV